MSIRSQSIIDNAQITSNENDFAASVEFIAPNGQRGTIGAFHNKHHLGLDVNNEAINSKKASVSFNESILMAANPDYPLRITNSESPHFGEVELDGHLINVDDSTGTIKKYVARQWFPDERLGLIVIVLNDYEA